MIQSVHRISQILNLFREHTSLSLTQIADKTGLAKTTAHGLVASLREEGLLEQDPETHRYALGLAIFELASHYHARRDIRAISIPFINDLAHKLGLTVQLAVLDRDQVVYLYKMTTAEFMTFSISVGLRMPFHCTATGKVLVSHMPADQRETLFAAHDFTPKTQYSICSSKEMLAAISKIQDFGYALDLNESELGLGGLAVPIFDENHIAAGALSVSFLAANYSDDFLLRVLPPLKTCACFITRKLGGTL